MPLFLAGILLLFLKLVSTHYPYDYMNDLPLFQFQLFYYNTSGVLFFLLILISPSWDFSNFLHCGLMSFSFWKILECSFFKNCFLPLCFYLFSIWDSTYTYVGPFHIFFSLLPFLLCFLPFNPPLTMILSLVLYFCFCIFPFITF